MPRESRGKKRGGRHLGLEADGRLRPDSAAILWRPEHRGNAEFAVGFGARLPGERIRRKHSNLPQ